MKIEDIERLKNLHNYLYGKKENAIKSFNNLLEIITPAPPEWVVIYFTYNTIELVIKKDTAYKLHRLFEEVICKDEMDDFIKLDYDSNDKWQEFCFWKFREISWIVIETWMLNCFEASKIKSHITVPIYFKQNHDSMEILNLNTYDRRMEKSELEMFMNNNIAQSLDLLPSS